jgi:ribosome-binding factor A
LAIDGDDNEVARSLEGLNAARGYIRRELGARLRLRQAPEIFFSPDRSQQHAARVDALLERLKRQNR